jgi:GTPase SAR1 family protein
LKETRENCPENVIHILVGNQADKAEERKVSKEEALDYMKRERFSLFFETSAKDGQNVDKVQLASPLLSPNTLT